jgi:predicted porin
MKKVLSLAIAAALVAPAAAMADATLFGKAHFIVENVDTTTTPATGGASTSADVWGVDSVHSRIGVKGSEDLGNGLTAVYHFEFKVNQDDDDGLDDRNQFIGLAGGFGTVLLGSHDTPLKMSQGKFDQFGDLPWGDIGKVMPGEDRVDNVIAYVSPAMGGLTLVGALVAGENGDATAADLAGAESDLTGIADHISLAGLYSNGPIFASLAYNQYDIGNASQGLATALGLTTFNADPTLIRGTLIWDGGNWQVGGMYSSMDLDVSTSPTVANYDTDADAYGISGNIKIGANGKLKAQYLVGDDTVGGINGTVPGFTPNVNISYGDDETTMISFGYEHALSERTILHAGYTMYEVEAGDRTAPSSTLGEETVDTEVDSFFVGMIHNF